MCVCMRKNELSHTWHWSARSLILFTYLSLSLTVTPLHASPHSIPHSLHPSLPPLLPPSPLLARSLASARARTLSLSSANARQNCHWRITRGCTVA